MSPNPSPAPHPGIRIITSYERDVVGAAEALLAMLRQSHAQTPNTEPRTKNEREAAEEAIA